MFLLLVAAVVCLRVSLLAPWPRLFVLGRFVRPVQHVQKVNHESLNSRYRLEALVSDRLSLAMAVKVLCLRWGT